MGLLMVVSGVAEVVVRFKDGREKVIAPTQVSRVQSKDTHTDANSKRGQVVYWTILAVESKNGKAVLPPSRTAALETEERKAIES
jgi:ribosomal protein S1